MKLILKVLIQWGGKVLRSDTHKLINYVRNKVEFSEEWKESVCCID